ncbi:SURF1 family protein [Georgenia wangjunii]|uniref:SURF1 family protein n=1 Tax=Georgenia wangjunii TaxID=3117730 RepID=UPI002F268543
MEDPDSRETPGSLDLDRSAGPGVRPGTSLRADARGADGRGADGRGHGRRAAAREWLRAAASPGMAVLLVLVLVVGGLFVRLGFWQLDRAGIRAQEAVQVERAERLAADPVPVEDVLAPQRALTADELGRRVGMTGQYAAGEEVLVPGRQVDGVDAVLVVTALHLTEGAHAGAIMPVVRGWVPSAELAASGLEAGGSEGGIGELDVPDAPTGAVDVVGVLSAGEAVEADALPPGQVGAISPAQLTNLWGGPMFSAYLVAQTPEQGAGDLGAAPAPVPEGGLNLQSLAYAIEWWVFAAFALVMWLRILRDRVRDARDDARP